MAEKSITLAQAIIAGRRSSDPKKREAFLRAIELNELASTNALEALRAERRRDLRRRFGAVFEVATRVKEMVKKIGGDALPPPIDPTDLN